MQKDFCIFEREYLRTLFKDSANRMKNQINLSFSEVQPIFEIYLKGTNKRVKSQKTNQESYIRNFSSNSLWCPGMMMW